MGIGLALFAVGSALRTFNEINADQAEANASSANAAYYKDQEKYMLEEMFRELRIFDRKATRTTGEQKLTLASRGQAAMTSDDMMKIAYEKTLMGSERMAIQRAGEFKARLAGLRAKQAEDKADALRSPERALARGFGLLTGFSKLDFSGSTDEDSFSSSPVAPKASQRAINYDF